MPHSPSGRSNDAREKESNELHQDVATRSIRNLVQRWGGMPSHVSLSTFEINQRCSFHLQWWEKESANIHVECRKKEYEAPRNTARLEGETVRYIGVVIVKLYKASKRKRSRQHCSISTPLFRKLVFFLLYSPTFASESFSIFPESSVESGDLSRSHFFFLLHLVVIFHVVDTQLCFVHRIVARSHMVANAVAAC